MSAPSSVHQPEIEVDDEVFDVRTFGKRNLKSRSAVFRAIARGELVAFKFGKRTGIFKSEETRWRRSLKCVQPVPNHPRRKSPIPSVTRAVDAKRELNARSDLVADGKGTGANRRVGSGRHNLTRRSYPLSTRRASGCGGTEDAPHGGSRCHDARLSPDRPRAFQSRTTTG